MAIIRWPALALAVLGLGLAAGPSPAAGQEAIVVIDMQRVLQEAAAADQLRRIERQEREALRAQLDATSRAFEEEEALLTRLRDELPRDDFDLRVTDFDQRVRAARLEAQQISVAFQSRFAEAFSALEKEAAPVIAEVMADRRAAVALDRRSVLVVAESADITGDIIDRLDAILPASQARALLPPEAAPR